MRNVCLLISVCGFALLLQVVAKAQGPGDEYTIGVGDVLSVTFWQEPELNTTAKVGSDGKIELPIIGRISAAGLTPSSLSEQIVAQISIYNPEITQATVQVTRFASKYVYVMGQVRSPGKYTFERIPTLWEIILEAGGPTATAKLTQVTIIRGSGPQQGEITHVNLTRVLERGDLSALPPIDPGDTIQIPAVGEEAIGAGPRQELTPKDVIYILGAVERPGAVPYEPEVDILEAIALAGGARAGARLGAIRVISRTLQSGTVTIVDLDKYTDRANPVPIFLQPRDVIYVPERRPAVSAFASEIFRIAFATLASAIIFTLVR